MSSVPLKRWTRAENERLDLAGILAPAERVELVEGEIWLVGPRAPATRWRLA